MNVSVTTILTWVCVSLAFFIMLAFVKAATRSDTYMRTSICLEHRPEMVVEEIGGSKYFVVRNVCTKFGA